jgi:hypothetical protein
LGVTLGPTLLADPIRGADTGNGIFARGAKEMKEQPDCEIKGTI